MLWRRGNLLSTLYALRYAGAAGLVALLAALAIARPVTVLGVIAAGLGVWLIAGSITDLARRAGSFSRLGRVGSGAWSVGLAHAGLGICALGCVGSGVWHSEVIQVLAPGGSMTISGYELRLNSTEQIQGPNYKADRANITVLADGREITTIFPEKRNYPAEQMVTTQSAIRTTIIRDLYVVLGDPREGGGWVVRAYVNPLAPFIWLGAIVMGLGGFFALGSRISARIRARRAAAASAVAEAAE
jgi:cytochrome c-type biogenesis protein CcmF